MSNKNFNLLSQKIKSANNIAIFMHHNPDGDAIGCAGALAELIHDNFGKSSILFYSGGMSKYLWFLPYAKTAINSKDFAIDEIFDLAIAVDVGSFSLLKGNSGELFSSAKDTVKIDHHPDSNDFARLNIHKNCPAAGEIIYDIAINQKWKITSITATAIYTAIYTDTARFNYVDTARPFKVSAALIKLGASPRNIADNLNVTQKDSTLANARAVADAEFLFDGKLAIATINKQQNAKIDGNAYFEVLSMLRNIEDVEYVALLKERPNEISISLRSNTKPVNHIAANFGGGGHAMGAGCEIKGTLANARKKIIAAFEQEIQNSK